MKLEEVDDPVRHIFNNIYRDDIIYYICNYLFLGFGITINDSPELDDEFSTYIHMRDTKYYITRFGDNLRHPAWFGYYK
jgi:hypothetical protein